MFTFEGLSVHLRLRIIRCQACPARYMKPLPSGRNWTHMWLTCLGATRSRESHSRCLERRGKLDCLRLWRRNRPVGSPGSLRNFWNAENHFGGTTRSAYFLQFAISPEADEL